jgi:hypothetical protein
LAAKEIHHDVFVPNATALLKYFAVMDMVVWISHVGT